MEDFSEDVSTPKPIPIKQQISVPFLWEERPGKPKKDYCLLETTTNKSYKISSSIPIEREEKPEEPPIQFGERSSSSSPPSINNPFICNSEEKEMFKSYLETFKLDITQSNVKESVSDDRTSETTESTEGFCLSRSSSSSTCDNDGINGDVSVIEFFFPSSTMDEVLPQKACFVEDDKSVVPWKNENKRRYDLTGESGMTLGELILLSRNMNCGRREGSVHEHHEYEILPKEPLKKMMKVILKFYLLISGDRS